MDSINPFSSRSFSVSLLLGVLLLASAGCGRRAEAPSITAPLARVGETVITAADVVAEAQRLRAAGQAATNALSILNALVERAAMLDAARASEWANDPAARRERENLLLSQWLDHTLQAEKARVIITDDDLRADYDARRAAFTRPVMARLAILYRKPDARGSESTVEALTSALRQARQAYLDNPSRATRDGRIPGFGAIAAEASEHATSRYRGGDLGWIDPQCGDAPCPAKVAVAGFALPVGGVSDVLETEAGLYVVMKQDQREARTAPFEEVAETLRRRLLHARRDQVETVFKSNLLVRTAVEIDAVQAAALTLPEVPGPRSAVPALVSLPGFNRTDHAVKAASDIAHGKEETE